MAERGGVDMRCYKKMSLQRMKYQRYSPFLPKNWGRYPGVVLARQRAKRRGAQVGRGKRHFQHSLTVEKALCEPLWGMASGGA